MEEKGEMKKMLEVKEGLRKSFSKVKFYDKVLWKNYLSVIGVISSFVTLISFFTTAQNLKVNIGYAVIGFIIILTAVFAKMWWNANQQNCAKLKINNTKIIVQEGDIFELLEKEPENREGEISIIGVNDYYDVIVDDRIIAKESLHGKYIKKIVQAGKLELLDKVIATDEILNKPDNGMENHERAKGKKIRYSIGSVVEFESYILAAFTKFDENNKAYLSAADYTGFWMHFWENIDEIYAGRTINIPLMGAGITRFRNGKPSKQELLETMLWTLKISGFHNTYGHKQIKIVIYKSDVEDIDFYHIQYNPSFK